MLDRQHGVEHEGEEQQQDVADGLAITAYNMLRNGMGGIDWAGLPLVCEYLGISDVEGLLDRIMAIMCYVPPEQANNGAG